VHGANRHCIAHASRTSTLMRTPFRILRSTPSLLDIYFTYVSLWEGLFIVGLFDLNAPVWLIAAVAVGVLILGALLFNNYRRRILAPVAA
jgi:hypothetical protein